MNRVEQRTVLEALRKTLGQEVHSLRERPDILWQQVYNRLQWTVDEEGDGPLAQVLAAEFKGRISPGARPWLHLRSRLGESAALGLVVKTSWVESCAFSPDGKTLASASPDGTVGR